MNEDTQLHWEMELQKFESFLQKRLGLRIEAITDRSNVERELARVDETYAATVHVNFADISAKKSGLLGNMSLPMRHGFVGAKAHFSLDERLKNAILQLPDGEKRAKRILAHISNLVQVVNHDFTAHALGIDGPSKIAKTMSKKINFGEGPLNIIPAERLAVLSHRILFEKACEQAPLLRRFVIQEVRRALAIIRPLTGKEKQNWLTVIKYLLYSVIDPKETGIAALRSEFRNEPFKGLEPGYWAEIAHQKRFPLTDANMYVTDEDIFKIIYGRNHATSAEIIEKEILAAAKLA